MCGFLMINLQENNSFTVSENLVGSYEIQYVFVEMAAI